MARIPPHRHLDALFTARIHISDEDFNKLAISQSFPKNVKMESYAPAGQNQGNCFYRVQTTNKSHLKINRFIFSIRAFTIKSYLD